MLQKLVAAFGEFTFFRDVHNGNSVTAGENRIIKIDKFIVRCAEMKHKEVDPVIDKRVVKGLFDHCGNEKSVAPLAAHEN